MREEAGAEGEVRETISWIARRSLSRCSGLLMPISRWISVSDKLAMMAPLLTLARQAATYHAGMPTHSWASEGGKRRQRQRGDRQYNVRREMGEMGKRQKGRERWRQRWGKASRGRTERHKVHRTSQRDVSQREAQGGKGGVKRERGDGERQRSGETHRDERQTWGAMWATTKTQI